MHSRWCTRDRYFKSSQRAFSQSAGTLSCPFQLKFIAAGRVRLLGGPHLGVNLLVHSRCTHDRSGGAPSALSITQQARSRHRFSWCALQRTVFARLTLLFLLVHSRWCTHDRSGGAPSALSIRQQARSRHRFSWCALQRTVFARSTLLFCSQCCWCTRAGALMIATTAQPSGLQSVAGTCSCSSQLFCIAAGRFWLPGGSHLGSGLLVHSRWCTHDRSGGAASALSIRKQAPSRDRSGWCAL